MNKTNDMVEIYDTENNIWLVPFFIRRFLIKNYYQQGFVYIENGEPTYCSSTIKWLENVYVETTSQKRANELIFNYFKKIIE